MPAVLAAHDASRSTLASDIARPKLRLVITIL